VSSKATQPRRLPPEERRQQIVQAVLETVAEHGVPGATVSRIAKAANVSEGTLYVYFESRDEMLRAALDSIFFEMAGLIDSSEETDALERLRDIGRRHSELMKTERGGFALPWMEFIAAGPQVGLREVVAQTQRRAFTKMLSIVEQGLAEGTIRPDLDAERLTWEWYTVVWAENMSCLMGLTEFIDDHHSAYLLDLIIGDAAAEE
jgi:TetR/AcrR family fatty acid metabolism transcriptional regulator